jgi:kynureninase
MITEVDYRTGRRHDMKAITGRAHAAGALAIWDLAHSAGAFPVELAACGADFACGCTYKYLNSGPGGPAFIYVAPRHQDRARPALSGWLGHEAPFAFDADYRPGKGVERMRVGTPPILQMAALDAAMDIWDRVDMLALRAASLALTDRFIAGVEAAEGVIGDFRAPDILRFGFTPLFIGAEEVDRAVAILARVMDKALWDTPAYKTRAKVT